MTDITKLNLAQKKVIGKKHTWNSKKWYEEEDGILTFQHAANIWIDEIPSIPANNGVLEFFEKKELTKDMTVQNNLSYFVSDTDGKINGFVPPSYGWDYTVQVYINDIKIPSSHASGWFFDYANGILNFENTPPSGTITISCYRYIGRTLTQFIDTATGGTIGKGVLGLDSPTSEYTIQHNLNSTDILNSIFVLENIDGIDLWKKDIMPFVIVDENRIKIFLSDPAPIKFILQAI